MSAQSPQQLWETALGQLQLQVSRPNFETWLKGTIGLRYIDRVFVIGVSNDFIREWLDAKLRPLITGTLSRLLHDQIEVAFELLAGKAQSEEPVPEHSAKSQMKVESSPVSSAPIALRPRLNDAYTFERFVVGPANRLAHAAALTVAESPGSVYNPLFIYGGVGLGKTHLLHAIGHRALEKNHSILYLTAEQFTNEFVASLAQRKIDEFRRKHRQIRVFLVDDIQFLVGKERTQEEFFYTFNELHAAGSQIVLTSDCPPRALDSLEERLRSRCEGGLIVDVQMPDVETRMAILRAKASERNIGLPSDVTQLLARQAKHSVRELEGLLNRVAAYSRLIRANAIDKRVAEEALAALKVNEGLNKPPAQAVVKAVAEHFGVSPEALRSKGRQKPVVQARQIAMYILHNDSQENLSNIGRMLGQRDHSTVLHGIRVIQEALPVDADLQEHISLIKRSLKSTA